MIGWVFKIIKGFFKGIYITIKLLFWGLVSFGVYKVFMLFSFFSSTVGAAVDYTIDSVDYATAGTEVRTKSSNFLNRVRSRWDSMTSWLPKPKWLNFRYWGMRYGEGTKVEDKSLSDVQTEGSSGEKEEGLSSKEIEIKEVKELESKIDPVKEREAISNNNKIEDRAIEEEERGLSDAEKEARIIAEQEEYTRMREAFNELFKEKSVREEQKERIKALEDKIADLASRLEVKEKEVEKDSAEPNKELNNHIKEMSGQLEKLNLQLRWQRVWSWMPNLQTMIIVTVMVLATWVIIVLLPYIISLARIVYDAIKWLNNKVPNLSSKAKVVPIVLNSRMPHSATTKSSQKKLMKKRVPVVSPSPSGIQDSCREVPEVPLNHSNDSIEVQGMLIVARLQEIDLPDAITVDYITPTSCHIVIINDGGINDGDINEEESYWIFGEMEVNCKGWSMREEKILDKLKEEKKDKLKIYRRDDVYMWIKEYMAKREREGKKTIMIGKYHLMDFFLDCFAFYVQYSNHWNRVYKSYSQIVQLNNRKNQIISKNAQLKSHQPQLYNQFAQLNNQIAQINSHQDPFNSQIAYLNDKKNQIISKNAQLKSQQPQLYNQIAQLDNQIAQLKNYQCPLSGQVYQLHNKMVQLDNQIAQFKSHQPQFNSQLIQLNNQLSQLNSHQHPLIGQAYQLKIKIAQIKSYRYLLDGQLSQYFNQLYQFYGKEFRIEYDGLRLEEEIIELYTLLRWKECTIEKSEKIAADLNNEFKKWREENKQFKSTDDKLDIIENEIINLCGIAAFSELVKYNEQIRILEIDPDQNSQEWSKLNDEREAFIDKYSPINNVRPLSFLLAKHEQIEKEFYNECASNFALSPETVKMLKEHGEKITRERFYKLPPRTQFKLFFEVLEESLKKMKLELYLEDSGKKLNEMTEKEKKKEKAVPRDLILLMIQYVSMVSFEYLKRH